MQQSWVEPWRGLHPGPSPTGKAANLRFLELPRAAVALSSVKRRVTSAHPPVKEPVRNVGDGNYCVPSFASRLSRRSCPTACSVSRRCRSRAIGKGFTETRDLHRSLIGTLPRPDS
jgi:hypothetical protein